MAVGYGILRTDPDSPWEDPDLKDLAAQSAVSNRSHTSGALTGGQDLDR